jgi:uncharacterized membrane protein
LSLFVHGAIMFAFGTVALFFFRFFRDTKDRLFLLFGLSFAILALNRIGFLLMGTESELRTYLYFVRLVAFALIIVAIVDKNVSSRQSASSKQPVGNSEINNSDRE